MFKLIRVLIRAFRTLFAVEQALQREHIPDLRTQAPPDIRRYLYSERSQPTTITEFPGVRFEYTDRSRELEELELTEIPEIELIVDEFFIGEYKKGQPTNPDRLPYDPREGF